MTGRPVRAVRRRLGRRIGKRGAFLLAVGTGWLTYGWGIRIQPTYGVTHGLTILTDNVAVGTWGLIWMVAGALAVAAALARTGTDGVGFSAAAVPPLVWASAYVWMWAAGQYPAGWTSAAAWGSWALAVLIVSGMTGNPTVRDV